MSDRYVCVQCGAPGVVDPGFTLMDPRYATGLCTGTHEGPQNLIREGLRITDRPLPKKRRKTH